MGLVGQALISNLPSCAKIKQVDATSHNSNFWDTCPTEVYFNLSLNCRYLLQTIAAAINTDTEATHQHNIIHANQPTCHIAYKVSAQSVQEKYWLPAFQHVDLCTHKLATKNRHWMTFQNLHWQEIYIYAHQSTVWTDKRYIYICSSINNLFLLHGCCVHLPVIMGYKETCPYWTIKLIYFFRLIIDEELLLQVATTKSNGNHK